MSLGFDAVEIGPLDDITNVMLDADGNPNGYGRPTDCVHLSQIIKRIRIARGDASGNPPGWQEGTAMYAGFLWEWALEFAFRIVGLQQAAAEKQVRLRQDGICGTLDGVDHAGEDPVLLESKLTWKSMRKIQEPGMTLAQCIAHHFPDWILQLSGYLYMLSKLHGRWITEVRLYIFFVRGDYAKDLPAGPRVRVVALRFMPELLEENWQMFLRVKQEMEGE